MDAKDLKAIHDRLDELEKLIKTVKGEGISYQISIEHAEFHSPIVEHLDYHFDKLDVKEVSGALNLGNNFGVHVGQGIKKDGSGDDGDEKIADNASNRSNERPTSSGHTDKKDHGKNSKIQEDKVQESARWRQPSPPSGNGSKMSKQEPTEMNTAPPSAGQKKHPQTGRVTDHENTPSAQKKRPPVSEKPTSDQQGSAHRQMVKNKDPKNVEDSPIKISFFSRGHSTRE